MRKARETLAATDDRCPICAGIPPEAGLLVAALRGTLYSVWETPRDWWALGWQERPRCRKWHSRGGLTFPTRTEWRKWRTDVTRSLPPPVYNWDQYIAELLVGIQSLAGGLLHPQPLLHTSATVTFSPQCHLVQKFPLQPGKALTLATDKDWMARGFMNTIKQR